MPMLWHDDDTLDIASPNRCEFCLLGGNSEAAYKEQNVNESMEAINGFTNRAIPQATRSEAETSSRHY